MNPVWIIIGLWAAVALFLSGFLLGIWLVTREVSTWKKRGE
jgi:uncharacterized protein YneF (UPF0154 family)